MTLIVITIITGVLFVAAHNRFGSVLMSPVQIVPGGLVLLGCLGWVFYDSVAGTPGGAGIRIYLTDGAHERAFVLLVSLAAAMLVGSNVAGVLFGWRSTGRGDPMKPLELPPALVKATLIAAPIPLLVLIAVRGETILRRGEYIAQHVGGSVLASSSSSVSLAVVAALGFLWAKRKARLYVALVTVGYLVVLFGSGSRRLSLMIAVFALGAYVAKPGLASKIGLLAGGFASVFALSIPLTMRQSAEHGVLPYWEQLPDVLAADLPFAQTGLNLLVGFAIVHMTAFEVAPIPDHDMWVAFNPLPGGLVGWGDLIDGHRLNYFAPYGGAGELGNAGWAWVFGGGIFIGFVLAFLNARTGRFIARGQHVFALAIVGLCGLFTLFLTQYTLRAGMRMLYYAVAFAIAAEIWNAHRSKDGRRSADQPKPALRSGGRDRLRQTSQRS